MDQEKRKMFEAELAALRKEVHENGIRLTLAHGWVSLLHKAYDALLSWGINFKTIPEYKRGYPDDADGLPLTAARAAYFKWMSAVESGISAAVRRKQFKLHENDDPDLRD